jgi:hypothetical protein
LSNYLLCQNVYPQVSKRFTILPPSHETCIRFSKQREYMIRNLGCDLLSCSVWYDTTHICNLGCIYCSISAVLEDIMKNLILESTSEVANIVGIRTNWLIYLQLIAPVLQYTGIYNFQLYLDDWAYSAKSTLGFLCPAKCQLFNILVLCQPFVFLLSFLWS